MSQVHKVIVLNKPLKIFEFTPFQLILLVGSVILALIAASKCPKEWKFNGVPGGAWVAIGIVCVALVLVKMSELKPWAWWKNLMIYRMRLVPNIFLPKPEPAPLYPDPTIIEPKKRSEEFYVESQ